MPASTLRKHLAVLVDAGLVLRRDSPNGKRYARKGRGGEIAEAFGFDLSPLVARAGEFERLAEQARADERALKCAKERVTLARRDIVKMIAAGMEAQVPVKAGPGLASWEDLHALYRRLIARLPRTPTLAQLEAIAADLSALAEEILSLLESHVNVEDSGANESPPERHIQNSKPDNLFDSERSCESARVEPAAVPLATVLQACPDIGDYARGGVSTWRDLIAAAGVARATLGISPSAWEAARAEIGEAPAAVVVAAILQRGEAIASAGGYLRALTRKAQARQFSLGPMLTALMSPRRRAG
jgi:replication initiation protein RepC